MRTHRVWLQTMLAAFSALLAAAITIPVTEVSSYIPHLVADNRWLWFGLLIGIAVAMVITAGLPVWLEKTAPSAGFVGVPVTPGWIDRVELPGLVKALTAAGSEPVALTTGLVGAGGFGKTMLAARACAIGRSGAASAVGSVWITVGRDLSGAGLATRISETIRNLGHDIPPFTGPEQAGQALAETLGEARTLLVADDVWSTDQLKPFLTAGQTGRLLVTTRRPALLARAGSAHHIKVDTVTGEVARQMLTHKLPKSAASSQWTQELLDLTGGWPLLLSLVNHRLAEDVNSGAVLDRAAADTVNRLRQAGPTALDLDDLKIRESAVAATIDYSLDVLEPPDRIRFLELGSPTRVEILPASADVAALLQVTPGAETVMQHQERFIERTPWSWQTSFYPMAHVTSGRAPRLVMAEDIREGVVSYLDTSGIEQAGYQDWITARTANANEQVFFHLPHAAAVFEIFRTAFDQGGTPVRVTVTVFPVDRSQFVVNVGDVPDRRRRHPAPDHLSD